MAKLGFGTKDEDIEEINDLLDTLSPARARQIFHKLSTVDLIDLKQAIADALASAKKRAESGADDDDEA